MKNLPKGYLYFNNNRFIQVDKTNNPFTTISQKGGKRIASTFNRKLK